MLVFLGFYIFFCLVVAGLMPLSMAELTQPFHAQCLAVIPKSEFQNYYSAIVCGKSLPASEFKNALKLSGLLHIIVVSGSHLIFLEALLSQLFSRFGKLGRFFEQLIWPLLFLFTLANQAQPPVTRALIAYSLRRLNARYRLNWNPVRTLSLSGLLTIPVCTTERHLVSLIMSWLASLVITSLAREKIEWQNFVIYFLLVPLLLPFGVPHPISILFNTALAPILGGILFPLSLVSCFTNWFLPLSDFGWRIFSQILSSLPQFTGSSRVEIPLILMAAYLAVLTLVFDRLARR